ncbi:MAG: hypothetical protein DME50_16770 [Verrucomicrobia bacterium]|nr:MAG: hypothetical protein DME50_16770 [Verrucomicrobiota bacterium]
MRVCVRAKDKDENGFSRQFKVSMPRAVKLAAANVRGRRSILTSSPSIGSDSGALRTSCLSVSPESYLISAMQPAESPP